MSSNSSMVVDGDWFVEPNFLEPKVLKATKMLKLHCKYIYFCYIVNIFKVNLRMDSIDGGSSTMLALDLSDKIKADFFDVFNFELPSGLPPRRNMEHRIELISRS